MKQVNLSAGIVHTAIQVDRKAEEEHELSNVPYIQSEHYDSSATFPSEQSLTQEEHSREIAHSSVIDSNNSDWLEFKAISKDSEDECTKEELQFTRHPNSSKESTQSMSFFPFHSKKTNDTIETKQSFVPDLNDCD